MASPLLLALLVCADVAFLLLHVVNKLLPSQNALYSLATDGGYAEVFQYIKEYWIALAFLALCWRTREVVYGAWALLFAYLLCDDALAIHERLGHIAATHWSIAPAFGLRTNDWGELSVSAIAGFTFLLCIAYFHVRSSANARNVSRDLAVLLTVLVLFGVVLDMVQIALRGLLPLKGLTIVEEFGEMITMSVIASYVVHLLGQQAHVAGALWRWTTIGLTGRRRRRDEAPS